MVTLPVQPALTMAIDEALLARAIEGGRREAIVRIYRWDSPALSVGAHMHVPEAVRMRCRRAGIEVVRRITGGGAVLHSGDLTYSVVAPHGGRGVMQTYRWVAGGLIRALDVLGLSARVARRSGPAGALACFAAPTGADIEVGGRKICGSAQVRRDAWFLQHGSIPIGDVRSQTAQLLGIESVGGSSCLELVTAESSWERLAAALACGFERAWGPCGGIRALDAPEEALATVLAANRDALPSGAPPSYHGCGSRARRMIRAASC